MSIQKSNLSTIAIVGRPNVPVLGFVIINVRIGRMKSGLKAIASEYIFPVIQISSDTSLRTVILGTAIKSIRLMRIVGDAIKLGTGNVFDIIPLTASVSQAIQATVGC